MRHLDDEDDEDILTEADADAETTGAKGEPAAAATVAAAADADADADADDDDRDDDDGDDGDDDAEPTAAGDDEPPEVSRKVRRRRRRTRPRSKTIAMKRLTREELRVGALMYPPVDVPRPQSRAECRGEPGPCPWVACKHHLYLDVNPETGSIKINFPDLEPWDLHETCALDVAERGGITLEEVGEIMNLTRERIRQVEVRGLIKLKMASPSPDELGAALLNPTGRDDLN
ncbi:MAG: hypothetical protein H6709_23035 [Kofleriaceae bacterium]|nr:hypothetical protein [Myxococcales bacterium]MCB9563547.1 hypothetical protein [Kofleriaceae bacterium]MCB9574959.1 hypothetical protein [Kofleriaceae bacterium]